jgi:hypothetical protein
MGMNLKHLQIAELGPVKEADMTFGDLTVLVGPQATGKSIVLELVKLLVDAGPVVKEMRRFNIDWGKDMGSFLDQYFGEGMSELYSEGKTRITADDRPIYLDKLLRRTNRVNELFFIPAQRVLSLRDGQTRPFTDYRAGDPFVVREFSQILHDLVQTEFSRTPELFPKSNRLKKDFRNLIAEHIFGEFGLKTSEDIQKRIVLSSPSSKSELPFLVWSAGQREFVPLLLGLYWLMPPSKVAKRGELEWVVIEELEMGLHPNAISVTILLVLELMQRGYRVCLSTHSPHVLDVVWALKVMQKNNGKVRDLLKLFNLPSNNPTKQLAERVLRKDLRVYYFQRDGLVQDISGLDPGADAKGESGWGGLSEFSGHVGDIVAQVVRAGGGTPQ